MTQTNPTYAFENDMVYALVDGQVIASGLDPDDVKEDAKTNLKRKNEKKEREEVESKIQAATHVVTPNGIKGKIVSHVKSWDDDNQVSVRFENGRIVNLSTSKLPVESFVTDQQKTAASDTPLGLLNGRLSSSYDHDKASLAERLSVLEEISREASQLLANGASFTDEQALDEFVVVAEAERSEVKEALDHLEQADIEAFVPFDPQVVEQATVGVQSTGSWLDHTVNTMIAEANEQDFKQILDEGPIEFVAGLSDAALADAGVVAHAARSFISQKTAGVESDSLEKFQAAFVERVEDARRDEQAERKKVARKEASVVEATNTDDGPDEGLFL